MWEIRAWCAGEIGTICAHSQGKLGRTVFVVGGGGNDCHACSRWRRWESVVLPLRKEGGSLLCSHLVGEMRVVLGF